MADGFSRSPVLIKGALIRFDAPMLIPIPNIIVFQYNPESLSRTLTVHEPAGGGVPGEESAGQAGAVTGRAQPTDPAESFTLRLIVDAADALEAPTTHPVAFVSGVADRIAALEMLLYPITEELQLLGSIGGSLSGAVGGAAASLTGAGSAPSGSPIPPRTVPVTLFVWGPGRIVPVRVTSFSVEEQSFSPTLYPVRAAVSLGLNILHPSVFQRSTGTGDGAATVPLKPEEELAVAAYRFTMVQKQVLATANLANSVESILNMLPI